MEAQLDLSRWSVQPSQASPEEGVSLAGRFGGGHRYSSTPNPLLVWGIPSSLEAFGSWLACLSLAELTGRKVPKWRGHGVGQRTLRCPTMPQLFTGSPCARFCGADMGHLHNLVLALGGESCILKVRIQSPNCYPGRGCGPPSWGSSLWAKTRMGFG